MIVEESRGSSNAVGSGRSVLLERTPKVVEIGRREPRARGREGRVREQSVRSDDSSYRAWGSFAVDAKRCRGGCQMTDPEETVGRFGGARPG